MKINLSYAPKFESSNISGLAFCNETETLYVAFLGGGTYAYIRFDHEAWDKLTAAITDGGSVGKFFHTEIKNKYDYLKITDLEIPFLGL